MSQKNPDLHRHHKRTHSIETESRRSAELSYRDSTKVIDKAELLIDTICKHLSTGNCDHCKKLVKESFDN